MTLPEVTVLCLFVQKKADWQLIESVITYVPIFIRIGPFNLFFISSSSSVTVTVTGKELNCVNVSASPE